MRKIIHHLRIFIFRGFLAFIPIGLSYLVLKFFYVFLDKGVTDIVYRYTGHRIPGLGILVILVLLYVTGIIASNVIGRQLFHLLEQIVNRIPLIKTIYQVGKQVSYTLSLPEKMVFKKAVLLNFFDPRARTVGFVTGTIYDEQADEKFYKVFIPTVPNPTTGYILIIKESDTFDPHWSVEEAIRVVISGGIIGPEKISKG